MDVVSETVVEIVEPKKFKEPPTEKDPLAKKWAERIEAARQHWGPFHKRVKHNRKLVSGFDWDKGEPDSTDFYQHRANLIHGTITAILPNIYARNPEISVTPRHKASNLKLFCKTLEKVTNAQLNKAELKRRAKSSVLAALTCSIGVVKVMYQRDMKEDPVIKQRIQDTQDNIARIEALTMQLTDEQQRADQDVVKQELEQTLAALKEQVEVVASEGLVIDRVLTDHLLIDPTVAEFWDYKSGGWIAQIVPMKKSVAQGLYGYSFDGAKSYKESVRSDNTPGRILSGKAGSDEDTQLCIIEIWDRDSQRVYTMVDGCDYWARDPYSPDKVGERWMPYVLLPFQIVDGQVVGPSLVDLTERLQAEHNDTRDKENKHRDAIKPGWIGDAGELKQKDVEAVRDAAMNEITLIEANGKPVSQVIMPKNHPALDPAIYDTGKIRYDWEQVSGMQDAARSSVVQPKTATEASIMQQSLSGRVSEFRDQVEDFVQEIAIYAAQLLIQNLAPAQVEKIVGPNKMGPLTDQMGQPVIDASGMPVTGIIEHNYDWPQLTREEVFELVELQIRAGTTGEPDKIEQQETWIKLMPVAQPLIMKVMEIHAMGGDAEPLIELLRETFARFDEKIDVEKLIPKKQAVPVAQPSIPTQVPQPQPMGA